MNIFELTQPGTWLEGVEDEQSRRDAESLLGLLTTCVQDAAIGLGMFEQCQRAVGAPITDSATRIADIERQRLAEERLTAALPPGLSAEDRFHAMADVWERSRQEVKRERWDEGILPSAYVHRIPFLHAKTCLYAFDSLHKALEALVGIPGVPSAVAEVLGDYEQAFPKLRCVRDSSHHVEDRIQGKKRKTRIDLQPVVNEAISAPAGGVLVVDMLIGNRYGSTLADGSYGEVEVSTQAVAQARSCVQRVLNAFEWHGPAIHLPS